MLPRKGEIMEEDESSGSDGESAVVTEMAIGIPSDVDNVLHSRQLAMFGPESMRRIFDSTILVSGMRGLGAEIGNLLVSYWHIKSNCIHIIIYILQPVTCFVVFFGGNCSG